MRIQLLVATVILSSFISRANGAGIVNGDFETGDLTGWEYSEPPGTLPGTATIIAEPSGNHYLELRANSNRFGLLQRQIEITGPSRVSFEISGWVTIPLDYRPISPFINAWVSPRAAWSASFNSPLEPHQLGDEFSFRPVFDPTGLNPPPPRDVVIPDGTYYIDVSIPGLYSLAFGVAGSRLDGPSSPASDARLTIDNITLTPIPEPSTLAMALGGLTISGLVAPRRQRRQRQAG